MPVPGNVIGTAVLRLETDSSKLVQGLKTAEAQLKGLSIVGAAAGAALVGGLGLAVKSAISFESAFAGVRKTVDGTEAELDAISDAFRQMAKEMPASVNELARIGEAAGQVGVSKENIVEFTRTMAMLGETTNIVAEQAATDMARFMNVMKTAPEDVDNLASTLVALGNAGASTEQDILNMATRISGAAAVVGLTEQEVLGFSNALSSMGIEAEAGGTAFSKVISTIHQAVLTGGEELEVFAELAGLSVDAFRELWSEDTAGAVVAVVAGLGQVSEAGGNVYEVLEQIGLTDARVTRMLLSMAGNSELVADSLTLANDAFVENTALTTEYGKRVETTAAQLQIAKNRLNDMAITLGSVLLPVVADAAGVFGTLAEGVADAFEMLPESSQQLLLLGAAVAGLAPLLLKAAAAATTFASGMTAAHLATLGWVGVAAAAVIAANNLAEALTGKGLIELLADGLGFGDEGFEVTEATVEAVKALRTELEAAGGTTGQLELLNGEFDALVGAGRPAAQTLAELNEEVANADAAPMTQGIKDAAAAMGELDQRAFALGRSHGELGLSSEELTANLQELVDAGLGTMAEAYEAGVGSVKNLEERQKAFAEATAEATEQAELAGPSLEQLRSGAMSAADAFSAAVNPTGDFADEEERAEAAAKALELALLNLVGAFADFNPGVLEAQFANARLREELDDLNRSGETYSTTLGLTKQQIEDTIAANEDYIASQQANQTAIEEFLPYLARFIGEEGFGRVASALNEAGVGHEAQIDLLGRLGDAYTVLSKGGITTAIDAFAGLKATLGDSAAWDEIARQAGPDLVAKIQAAYEEGLIDEATATALVEQVRTVVGDAAAAGLQVAEAEAPAIGTALAEQPVHTLTPDPMANALSAAVGTAVATGTTKAGEATAVGTELADAGARGITPDPMANALSGAVGTAIGTGTTKAGEADATGEALVEATALGIEAMQRADVAAREMVAQALAEADIVAATGNFVGTSFGEGIATGIDNAAGTVIAAARSIASSAVSAAKAILDIFSPSGVTEEEIGEPFVEGIIEGIEAKRAALLAEMKSMTAAALAEAQLMLAELDRMLAVAEAKQAAMKAAAEAAAADWPAAPGTVGGVTVGGPGYVDPSGGLVPGATPTISQERADAWNRLHDSRRLMSTEQAWEWARAGYFVNEDNTVEYRGPGKGGVSDGFVPGEYIAPNTTRVNPDTGETEYFHGWRTDETGRHQVWHPWGQAGGAANVKTPGPPNPNVSYEVDRNQTGAGSSYLVAGTGQVWEPGRAAVGTGINAEAYAPATRAPAGATTVMPTGGGACGPTFSAVFNIEGNADEETLRDALNRWWQERLVFEFDVLARRDGVVGR